MSLARSPQLSSEAARALRGAILSGEVAAGARLSVPAIARQLGISRTPAREALIILEREGLVRSSDYGMVVMDGDHGDVEQLLEMREALEGMSARLAAERISSAQQAGLIALLDEYDRALEIEDIDAHVAFDARFHRLIAAAADNRRLADSIERTEAQIVVLNNTLSWQHGWSAKAVHHDHGQIGRAIVAGDGDAAERAMRSHIRRMRSFYRSTRESAR